jgi:hypothetical protein
MLGYNKNKSSSFIYYKTSIYDETLLRKVSNYGAT